MTKQITRSEVERVYVKLFDKVTTSKTLTQQYKKEDIEDSFHNVVTHLLERAETNPLVVRKTSTEAYIMQSVFYDLRAKKDSTTIFDLYSITEEEIEDLQQLKSDFFDLVLKPDSPVVMRPQERAVLRYRLEVDDSVEEVANRTGYSKQHIKDLTTAAKVAIRQFIINNQNNELCKKILEHLFSESSSPNKPFDIVTYFNYIKQLRQKPVFHPKKRSGKKS